MRWATSPLFSSSCKAHILCLIDLRLACVITKCRKALGPTQAWLNRSEEQNEDRQGVLLSRIEDRLQSCGAAACSELNDTICFDCRRGWVLQ